MFAYNNFLHNRNNNDNSDNVERNQNESTKVRGCSADADNYNELRAEHKNTEKVHKQPWKAGK